MNWDQHLLFPTRVITAQSNDEEMIADLAAMFTGDDQFRDPHFVDKSDTDNLLDRADRHPVLNRLKDFMWKGMLAWLDAEGSSGSFKVSSFFFPNYLRTGGFVPAHNHLGSLSGVFYVKVPRFAHAEALVQGDEAQYWHLDYGALILHDPRFNSSQVELSQKTYAKVFPRPGMAILFPSYLWHSVTPHLGDDDRIAIAVNFHLETASASSRPPEELSLPRRAPVPG